MYRRIGALRAFRPAQQRQRDTARPFGCPTLTNEGVRFPLVPFRGHGAGHGRSSLIHIYDAGWATRSVYCSRGALERECLVPCDWNSGTGVHGTRRFELPDLRCDGGVGNIDAPKLITLAP